MAYWIHYMPLESVLAGFITYSIWYLLYYFVCSRKPLIIDGTLDSFSKATVQPRWFEKMLVMENVTFTLANGTRKFFKRVCLLPGIRFNLSHDFINNVPIRGKFLFSKGNFQIELFAFTNGEYSCAFKSDMINPHGLIRIAYNLVVRYSIFYFFKDGGHLTTTVFVTTVCALSTISYLYNQIYKKRKLHNIQLKMLDEASIPHPLG